MLKRVVGIYKVKLKVSFSCWNSTSPREACELSTDIQKIYWWLLPVCIEGIHFVHVNRSRFLLRHQSFWNHNWGQWQLALELLFEVLLMSFEPDIITYGAAISACEERNESQLVSVDHGAIAWHTTWGFATTTRKLHVSRCIKCMSDLGRAQNLSNSNLKWKWITSRYV